MSDSTKAALVASIAAGYLLGRGRKTKLALAVATYLASGKLRAQPQQLLSAGAEKLGESPQLSQLSEQVRSELLTVGRQALKAALDHRLGTFADSLAERTKLLSQVLEDASPESAENEQDEEEDEQDEGEQEEEGAEGKEKKERAPATQQRRKTGGPRREAAESAPSQQSAKRTAKKAPPKKTARRTAQKSPESSNRRR
jgi:hypothetical protein